MKNLTPKKMNNISFLGLGSNIGKKKENILKAIKLIASSPDIRLLKKSKFYNSPPYGYLNQESFINCVVKIETELSPYELFEKVKNMEALLGRKPTFRWGPRIIDIDILFYNDMVISSNQLTIPHPDLHNRAFVLVPMVEIESEFVHPLLKKSMLELLKELNISEIQKLKEV